MKTFFCVVFCWHLVSASAADIYNLIINPDQAPKSAAGGHTFVFINDSPCSVLATEQSFMKQMNQFVRPGTNRIVLYNRSGVGRYELQVAITPGNKMLVKTNVAVKQQVEFLLSSNVWEPSFYSAKIGDTNVAKRQIMADLSELVQKLKQPNKSEAVKLLMEGQWDWQPHAYNTSEATLREAQEASVQQLADFVPERDVIIANDLEVVGGNNLVLVYSKARTQSDRPCFVILKAPGKKDIRLLPMLLWRKGDRWVVW